MPARPFSQIVSYARGDLGISAFRVSTSFDSPSGLVSTASNALAGDDWFSSVERVLKPTILTLGTLLRRRDAVTRLSCGCIKLRSTTSQMEPIAFRTADTPSSTASHTL